MDGARVRGGILLVHGLCVDGEVRLVGARIGTELVCKGGTFKNPGRDALSADGIVVDGSVFLCAGFCAEGCVSLVAAEVSGKLECDAGTFKNPSGTALDIDHANIRGIVSLSGKFSAEGEVRIAQAHIGTDLDCGRGTFTNPGGKAVFCERIRVEGDVFLDDAKVQGGVCLVGARVGGLFVCTGDDAFDQLDLDHASVEAVAFEGARPPKSLSLDGLAYNSLCRDAEDWLRWLGHVDEFRPQPYQQLAQVLRDTGDTRGARRVLFEMEHRRRKHRDCYWYERVWSWLLKETIGYGYMSWRALWWMLAMTLVGLGVFSIGYTDGLVSPNNKEAYDFFAKMGYPPAGYPEFNPLVFSLEHTFPLVNLGLKDHWTPASCAGCVPVIHIQLSGDVYRRHVLQNLPGSLRWWLWFQVLTGWLLATLFVTGITGIVKSH